MPTFTQIGSAVTVGAGGASSIDFSSIPSTYTDLAVYISARSARSANSDSILFKINGSTTSYNYKQLYGGAGSGSIVTGSAGGSYAYLFGGIMPATNNTASTFSSQWLYFPNYTASVNKSVSIDSVSENNASTYFQLDLVAGLWSNTSAITSLSFYSENAANFSQYSTAYLYGVSNA